MLRSELHTGNREGILPKHGIDGTAWANRPASLTFGNRGVRRRRLQERPNFRQSSLIGTTGASASAPASASPVRWTTCRCWCAGLADDIHRLQLVPVEEVGIGAEIDQMLHQVQIPAPGGFMESRRALFAVDPVILIAVPDVERKAQGAADPGIHVGAMLRQQIHHREIHGLAGAAPVRAISGSEPEGGVTHRIDVWIRALVQQSLNHFDIVQLNCAKQGAYGCSPGYPQIAHGSAHWGDGNSEIHLWIYIDTGSQQRAASLLIFPACRSRQSAGLSRVIRAIVLHGRRRIAIMDACKASSRRQVATTACADLLTHGIVG